MKKSKRMEKNGLLLIFLIIILSLIVLFLFIFAFNHKKNDLSKVSLKQIYSSDYDIFILDKDLYYGTYNNNLGCIIDSNGVEIVKLQDELSFEKVIKTKNGNYLFYTLKDGSLTSYLYKNKELKNYLSISGEIYPVIDNDLFGGFLNIRDGKIVFYNIMTESQVEIENAILVESLIKEGNYILDNQNYIIFNGLDNMQILVNINNNEIITLSNVIIYQNGMKSYLNENNYYSLYDSSDNVLLKDFKNLNYDNGYYIVLNKNNKIEIYDEKLNKIIKLKYGIDDLDYLKISKRNKGFNIYNTKNSEILFVDKDKIIKKESVDKIIDINNNFIKKDKNYYLFSDDLSSNYQIDLDNFNFLKRIINIKDYYLIEYYNSKNELKSVIYNTLDKESIINNYGYYYYSNDDYIILGNKDLNVVDNEFNLIKRFKWDKYKVNGQYVIVDKSIYKLNYKRNS